MILWTEKRVLDLYAAMMAGETAQSYADRKGLTRSAVISTARREYSGWGPQYDKRLPGRPTRRTGPGVDYLSFKGDRPVLTPKGSRVFYHQWTDPKMSLTKMVEFWVLGMDRLRAMAKTLGLGTKACPVAKPKDDTLPKGRLGYWPDDMQHFEDSETALAQPFKLRKAADVGAWGYAVRR